MRQNCPIFHHILRDSWGIFIEWEQKDMNVIHVNNAMKAYYCTGIYPLKPFLETWDDAIHGLGKELRLLKANMGIKTTGEMINGKYR